MQTLIVVNVLCQHEGLSSYHEQKIYYMGILANTAIYSGRYENGAKCMTSENTAKYSSPRNIFENSMYINHVQVFPLLESINDLL